MALTELTTDKTASQFISNINGNIQEVGGSAIVSVDGTATNLVDVLNEVFDGVTGAEELSVNDSATDLIDALNGNFEAADSTPQEREFENLTETANQVFPLYVGDTLQLIKKSSSDPIIGTSWIVLINADTNAEISRSPGGNIVSTQNCNAKSQLSYAGTDWMLSKSRSRCYKNPKHRWVVFGDSLSVMTAYQKQNGDYVDVGAGYSWVIGESNHEIAVNNRARSGSTIMQATYGVWDRAHATNFEPYDICSIMIGSNDFGYGGVAVSSFRNQYRDLVDYIKGQKPSIKLFICTPIKRGDMTTNTQGATLADFCDVIREVGQEKNVPVLDLFTLCAGSDLDFTIADNANTWSGHADNGSLVHDKLHPIQEAHRLYMAPWFKQFMVTQGFVEDW